MEKTGMQNLHRLVIAIMLLVTALIAEPAKASKCDSLEGFTWLLGDWQGSGSHANTFERWSRLDDSNWHGIGITERKSSPPSVESIRIVKMGDDIFYLAKPPQNDMPVAFKMSYCDAARVVFENPQHDFPQRIEYLTKTNGELVANVSAMDNAGFSIRFVAKADQSLANEALVRNYMKAYNQKNLVWMMSMAAEKIRWLSVDQEKLTTETESKAELAKAMKGYFANGSETHSALLSVNATGDFVSVVEKASWRVDKSKPWQSQCSPAVYQVGQGLIQAVWYFPATACL